MLKLNSKNFVKKSQQKAQELHDACIKKIEELKLFGITTKSDSKGVDSKNPFAKQWGCLANEALQLGRIDVLEKLLLLLQEAESYKNSNPTAKGVVADKLPAYAELLPLIQDLGSKKS